MSSGYMITGMGNILDAEYPLYNLPPTSIWNGTDDQSLKTFISKRGIRYKDRATRLALAASKLAMQNAAFIDEGYIDLKDPRFAVIACSNFGHVNTLIETIEQIRAEGSEKLSPMGLPNASANVVASTLAMWFGLRGPSLFLANGQATGLDALQFSANLIDSGRTDRVLVCAAESVQPTIARLFEAAQVTGPINIGSALILESTAAYHQRRPNDSAMEIRLNTQFRPADFRATTMRNPADREHYDLLPTWLDDAHSAAGLLSVQLAYTQLMQESAPSALRIDLDPQRPMALTLERGS